MAVFGQRAVQLDATQARLRNKQIAAPPKSQRDSKVTSMIELFSGNSSNSEDSRKTKSARNTLTDQTTNEEVVNSVEHSKPEKKSTPTPSPRRRGSSGVSIELQIPKPFVPEKPASLTRTAVQPKPTPTKTNANDKMLLPKRNGHTAQDRNVTQGAPHLLVNGNMKADNNIEKVDNPTTKRVSRAFDYWEHKIEPKDAQHRGPSPNEFRKSPNLIRGAATVRVTSGPYRTTLPKPQDKPPATPPKPNQQPAVDKTHPKSNSPLRNNAFIQQDRKPDLPTRPRFMTTASGLRKPNTTPFKTTEFVRVQSTLHSPARKGDKTTTDENKNVVKNSIPTPFPRNEITSPKRESNSIIPLTQPQPSKTPPLRPKSDQTVVNPLPKPQRTFTFNASTALRPNILPRVPKRDLMRVSSDTSSIESRGSSMSSSSQPRDTSYGRHARSSRAPSAGYEEVILFEPSANKNSQHQNTQKWERQHNYEDVDDSLLLKGRGSNTTNYDHITLDDHSPINRSLSDVNDGYEHLKFQQDLHRANPVSSIGNKSDSTKKQHKVLEKQDSDISDMMTRDNNLSKSQLSLESGNIKLQITDKIRDAFSTIGRRYKHHKKGYNCVEDDANYSTSGDEDSDTEMDLTKHKQTLERVRTLQKTYRKTIKYKSLEREMAGIDSHGVKLFEQVLISKIVMDQGKGESKVVYRFPAPPPGKSMGDEKTLAQFCFPDINELVPCEEMQSQSFSFMLTRENGTRKFGYCRRSLPPGKNPRYPVVYCLISALGSFGVYEKILEELEKRHRISIKNVAGFLDTLVVKNFPAPGRSITVDITETDGKSNKVVLRRPFDTRLEHVDLQCLLYELGIENTIKIFSSLLLERRVIICGKSLGILTACVYAFQALLYPFVWQHVFVPVLPLPMLDLCCTPTPLLAGIWETSLDKLQTLPLEEVFIVNLSTKEVVSSVGDELEILPRKFQTALMEALVNHTGATRGSGLQPSYDYATDYESAERNTVISESFMHLFVEMLGHYQNHFQPVEHNANTQPSRHGRIIRSFNRVSFYDDVTSRSLRRFLDLFMETQMFDGFIHSRELSGSDYEGLFERRIARHLLTADASHLNFKVIKTKMKKFFNRR